MADEQPTTEFEPGEAPSPPPAGGGQSPLSVGTDEEYENAKDLVVEAICGGLENGVTGAPPARPAASG